MRKKKISFYVVLDVPIYGDVVVVATDDNYKRVNAFCKRKGIDPPSVMPEWQGFMENRSPYFFIILNGPTSKKQVIDLLGHEVFHLTHRILECRHVIFTPDNHEPFAYLQGWLLEKIFEKLTL